MEFNEKLQLLRTTKGISQEKLAEELGISRQLISKWEEGDEIPDIQDLMALSDWFDISLDELLRDRVNSRTLQRLGFLEEEVEDCDENFISNIILTIAMIAMMTGFIFNQLLIGVVCGSIGIGAYYLMRLKKCQ